MLVVTCAALFAVGAALGIWAGMLCCSLFLHWETADQSYRKSQMALLAIFGGGFLAGGPIFKSVLNADEQAILFYILGLGVAFVIGVILIYSKRQRPHSYANVKYVVIMNDSLREQYPDRNHRVQIIATGIVPMADLMKETGKTEEQLTHEATEAMDNVNPPDGDEE